MVDTTPPSITCPADIIIENDPGICGANVVYAVSGIDGCGSVTIIQTGGLPSGSIFPVGTTTNTFNITDECGNTSICSFDVTVNDPEAPVAICADFTAQLDASGNVSISPGDVDGGSFDNCGISSMTIVPSSFTCADVGANIVTLTVTDVSGNTSTCTATVTIEDNVPSVAVCQNIDVFLDVSGNAFITPTDVDGGSTDACGIASLSIDIDTFTCDDIGPNNVTLTVTDVNGNSSTCVAIVNVVDQLAPELVCPEDQTQIPGSGSQFYEVPDYFANGEASATDNCTDPVTNTGQDPAPGTLLPDGVYTVTIWAEDEYGNYSECDFELTVEIILEIGDDKPSLSSLILNPNPANDVVILSNPQEMLLDKIDFYDLTGRLVQSVPLVGMGVERSIDVSDLASAPYLVIIQGENGSIYKQLIKE